MIKSPVKRKSFKTLSVFMALTFLNQLLSPTVALALTGGPSQPEVQSFTPIGSSEMVDLFTGDFNYNIPLLDVGGYPINLIYNSGVKIDQEASWVGLGWNINPGAINRTMRGVPDDFKGDEIVKEFYTKPNETYRVFASQKKKPGELFGLDINVVKSTMTYGVGISYNTYAGVGVDLSANLGMSAGEGSKSPLTGALGIKSGADGITITPELGLASLFGAELSGSAPFNSRAGMKALTFGALSSNSTLHRTEISSTINFGVQTFIPQVPMPLRTTAVTISFKTGGSAFGLDGTVNVGAAYSIERLTHTSDSVPAYGYLYSEQGQNLDKVLHDFNREKDGAFTLNTPKLPLTNYTYDIYGVSGQGISGTFRPFRSDVGHVYDSQSKNIGESYSLGMEIAGGNVLHNGVDMDAVLVNTQSGKWTDFNSAGSSLTFKSKSDVSSDKLYEPYYFKQVGEKSVDRDLLFGNIDGAYPIKVDLTDAGKMDVRAEYAFNRGYGNELNPNPFPLINYRQERVRRNQVMTFLNKSEALDYALQPNLSQNPEALGHHIAEVTILKNDGARYIYGLPLYNHFQKEVTFNVEGLGLDGPLGPVAYTTGVDDKTENGRGIDEYFSSVQLPAYAHSYLLTAVVSPDYVDADGIPGPSDKDPGTYTKFNYQEAFDYEWRVPFESATDRANYDEGLKWTEFDNKGHYIYGKKDLRYLESIESKNFIAIFDIADRADGFGVDNSGGARGTVPMKLLKEIRLYSKSDYAAGTNLNAVPIKVVHFVYEYDLCPGIPNNNSRGIQPPYEQGTNLGGKLTLKKVFFTHGKSEKGRLSPYEFDYHNDYPYNNKAYDRWGNYMAPLAGAGYGADDPLPNAEYPYVDQGGTNADIYARTWNLNKIDLPSGGTINIEYESDDYAYVQDKRAMQMFKLTGTGLDETEMPINTNSLMEIGVVGGGDNYNHLFFRLETQDQISGTLSQVNADKIFKTDYMDGVENMYFKFLVNMTSETAGNASLSFNGGKNYEYVSGYVGVDDYGVIKNGTNYDFGWIKLAETFQGDGSLIDVNPITKAAWQFGRLHTPTLVWRQPNVGNTNAIVQTVQALVGTIISNIANLFQGPNGSLNGQDFGKEIKTEKCWVRLLNPNKMKEGGGLRVKRLTIDDNWNDMVTIGSGFSYGQEYDYTMQEAEGKNATPRTISSGVAAYEPQIGGEENPWNQPIAFGDKREKFLIPDDKHFLTGPMGESFFPAPVVGYRQVTVRNLVRKDGSGNVIVNRNATGKVVHEFYTAYDFPVKISETSLEAQPRRTKPLKKLFKLTMTDNMTVSQGYAIELNDMHGKLKGKRIYAEGIKSPISAVEYRYKANGNQLNNSVTVINKDASTENLQVGLEFDLIGDMRESKTRITSAGLTINGAAFLAGILPFYFPTIWPSYSREDTRFRSAVLTKTIRRYGILEEVIAYDLGSEVSVQNLAYDAQTGDVLLTKTTNEYEDPIYEMTYPAHWSYDGMGPAYQNIGVSMYADFNVGVASITNAEDYFTVGDELRVDESPPLRGWVLDVVPGSITVIDKNGNAIETIGAKNIKVIRSGRRNLQATPIATITSLTNPLNNLSTSQFEEVVDAGAVEFSDKWGTECGFTEGFAGGCVCPPSSEAFGLEAFLNALAVEGELEGCFIDLGPTSNYASTYYNSELRIPQPPTTPHIENRFTSNRIFEKGYGDPLVSEVGVELKVTNEDGFIQVGYDLVTLPSGAIDKRILVVKTDCNGKKEWSNSYNSTIQNELFGMSITEILNSSNVIDGYVIVAQSADDLIVLKIDLNGNILISKSIGVQVVTSGTDKAKGIRVIQAANKEIVICGNVRKDVSNQEDVLLVRLSADLASVVWHKVIDFNATGGSFEIAHSIQEVGTDIFVSGLTNAPGYDATFLMKTDNTGALMFAKTYGAANQLTAGNVTNTEVLVAGGMTATSDGGFAMTGLFRDNSTTQESDIMLIKTDPNGEIGPGDFAKRFGSDIRDCGNSVVETNDGDFVITGVVSDQDPLLMTNNKAVLIKTDGSGTLGVSKVFPGGFGKSIVESRKFNHLTNVWDQNFALTGVNNIVNASDLDVFFAKTDNTGSTPCNSGATFSEASPTVAVTSTLWTVAVPAITISNVVITKFANSIVTEELCCSPTLDATVLGGSDSQGFPQACPITLDFPIGSVNCISEIIGFGNLQPVSAACSTSTNTGDFTIDAILVEGGIVTMTGQTTCWNMSVDCNDVPAGTTQCGELAGDVVNPFVKGIIGNWRPERAHLYLTERQQNRFDNNTNIRHDGTYSQFSPFWKVNTSNPSDDWLKDDNDWTFTSEVTRFSVDGFELENKDALDSYSSALFGYGGLLPIAVADNSAYRYIAFDGFEDYVYMLGQGTCYRSHFSYFNDKASLTKTEAHTGLYSMRLRAGQSLSVARKMELPCSGTGGGTPSYLLQDCDCIGRFAPDENSAVLQKYVLSAWVKEKVTTPPVFDYTSSISVSGPGITTTTTLSDDIIDGWQRIEVIFEIAANSVAGDITVTLNNTGSQVAFFDDIRIHPFQANMKSFVYHPTTLRLMAELDENNYATFYEYDGSGALIRVKKETHRGIRSIQESRNNTVK